MEKEDISISAVIVHIVDASVGMPVLSDCRLEYGADFADFLRNHIYKIIGGDDCKICQFYKEQSEVYQLLESYADVRFVEISKGIAQQLYKVAGSNPDIPPGDLVLVRFKVKDIEYLAVLKMNYKSSYTHKTMSTEQGNANEIIKYRSILPAEGQRLQEAAVINLIDLSVQLIEKKYEVNGEKTNYFSYLFLKCSSHLSHKAKLQLVTKAVEQVQKSNFDETRQYEEHMRAKSIINDTLKENGGFAVEEIAEKIFEEKPMLEQEFKTHIEKYDIVKEEIAPVAETTTRKYEKQYLTTDSGIEIKIPMDIYKNTDKIEFITNGDGSVSVVIKNIGHLTAKF